MDAEEDEVLQALALAAQQLANAVDRYRPVELEDGTVALRLIDASHALHRAVIALRG